MDFEKLVLFSRSYLRKSAQIPEHVLQEELAPGGVVGAGKPVETIPGPPGGPARIPVAPEKKPDDKAQQKAVQ